MTQPVRKRQRLTNMRYDRVDLVQEGANAHAHIVLAKNRGGKQLPPRSETVRKAMGQIKCNACGKMNPKGSKSCMSCHSTDLAKTRIVITKTVTNGKTPSKKAPKNDDATNAGQYTFEDEQYDQDNGENGQALGDAVERSVMNKSAEGWFEEDVEKSDNGEDVDSVDNEEDEEEKEGEDSDKDIEQMAMTKPTGQGKRRDSGYQNTNTSSMVNTGQTHKSRGFDFDLSFGKKKRLKKTAEVPGLNSYDHADEGSQNVAESAEQMYRSQSQPTEAAQTRLESTMSDTNRQLRVGKARRKRSNAEGLDKLENGNEGIYSRPGVKRNGTGTGHSKHTTRQRTAVAPPPNPLDKSRFSPNDQVALEALNLGVKFAENIARIHKSGNFEVYPEMMADFVEAVNAYAGEWSLDNSITKAKDAGKYAENIASRAYAILAKASPASEMSDEAAEGVDPDDMDSVANNGMGKLKDVGGDDTKVGKNKLKKSRQFDEEEDRYAQLDPVTKSQLAQLNELLQEKEQERFVTMAKSLRKLPGFRQETVAKQLQDAYDVSEENGEQLRTMLQGAANMAAESTIMKQYGMTGSGTATDSAGGLDAAMAAADAWATMQVAKSAGGKTAEQLRVEYMTQHPEDFYQPAKSLT